MVTRRGFFGWLGGIIIAAKTSAKHAFGIRVTDFDDTNRYFYQHIGTTVNRDDSGHSVVSELRLYATTDINIPPTLIATRKPHETYWTYLR